MEEIGFDRIAKGTINFSDDLAWKLREWKDKYKGKRCFVVGNGKSLLETPLDKLIGEHCFATNKISDVYSMTNWRPTLFQCMTTNTRQWLDEIKATIELGIPSFIWWRRANLIGYYPNIIWTEFIDESKWEQDIGKGLMKRGSSGLATVQLALYLGFNPIVLVGFDGNFREFHGDVDEDPNHFHGKYLGYVTDEQAARWNREWPLYHAMAKGAADVMGVEIIDATMGGSLTVYPKVNIHDLCR